jgi:alpha-beta hydrolase superfamily lysophospholipase
MTAARRAVVAVFFSLLLARCADPEESQPAAAAPATTPQLTADAFIADDGTRLPLRSWLPNGQAKAVVLAVHGINDYSHAFAGPGAEWARHGIATFAYDQRGFGAAPRRGSWAGTYLLDSDLAAMTRLLRARYPGVPLYLLGESMGGAVVITAETGAAGAERPQADGIILVAPAVWGRQTMNVFLRVALWTMDHVAPSWTFTGESLKIRPTDNIEILRELSRDPMVIKATRVSTIAGLVDLMTQAFAAAPSLRQRVLLLYGAHDEVVPADPTRKFIDALPPVAPGERTLAYYDSGYHMLLRDLDAELVENDIENWIFSPAVPLPSGADRRGLQMLAQPTEAQPPAQSLGLR